jgi:ABC-type methionine transport system ATPase subunit
VLPNTDEIRQQLLDDIESGTGVLSDAVGRGTKIHVHRLTKRSDANGEQIILKDVTLDVPTGVIMGIIGPSGSGKSTLLRALNRLWEPSAGSVFLDGEDICRLDVLSLRRKVGMLFQLPAMFDG